MLDESMQRLLLFILTIGGAYTSTLVSYMTLKAQVAVNMAKIREAEESAEERIALLHTIEKTVIRIEEQMKSFSDAHERNKTEINDIKKKLDRL